MRSKLYLSVIEKWRKTWKTESKFLSINGCLSETETIFTAIEKAHQPSVLRALKLDDDNSTFQARNEVKDYLLIKIANILHKKPFSFEEYEAFAKEVCARIRAIYRKYKINDYTYGNAQKMLSMTIKYILSADNIDPSLSIFEVAYIPIDGVIMRIAQQKLGVNPLPNPWSKTEEFDEIVEYERAIRKALPSGYSPLMWECENWEA